LFFLFFNFFFSKTLSGAFGVCRAVRRKPFFGRKEKRQEKADFPLRTAFLPLKFCTPLCASESLGNIARFLRREALP
jgi:hypothetical protein